MRKTAGARRFEKRQVSLRLPRIGIMVAQRINRKLKGTGLDGLVWRMPKCLEDQPIILMKSQR